MFFLLIQINIYSEINSKIKEVTVYEQSARITRTAQCNIAPGVTEIVINNLESEIYNNTLEVNIEGNAVLLSATSRIDYMSPLEEPYRIKQLKDSLVLVTTNIKWIQSQITIYKGEKDIITSNKKLGSEQASVDINDLKTLVMFYRERLMEIDKKILQLENDLVNETEIQQRIQKQINELNSEYNKPGGEVTINVTSKQKTTVNIELSYVTGSVWWVPVYDIRAENTEKPIHIVYKANITQNTGFGWNNVFLTISTGNPMMDNNRPILYPWYVDFYQELGIVGYGSSYKSKEAPRQMMQSNMAYAQEEMLDEVVSYDVSEKSSGLSKEFKIETLQSIPSDNKEHQVLIKETPVKADFIYHTVPKLKNKAFLLAKIAEFGDLDLQPGNANLFLDGMYIGQSYIDPGIISDTLLVSLGADEKISVKRTKIKDFESSQTIGNNIKVIKAYSTIIKNNHGYPVTIEVLDQLPISKNKDIEVKLEESDGAIYTENYGKLLWKISIGANQTKETKLIYSVKYPKDKKVILE